MLDWIDLAAQLGVSVGTFLFPPSGIILSQGGWGPDAQWNLLLTLCGYGPGLLHSLMVQSATPRPAVGRRAWPVHAKRVHMGKWEFRVRALDRVEGTAFNELNLPHIVLPSQPGVSWFQALRTWKSQRSNVDQATHQGGRPS